MGEVGVEQRGQGGAFFLAGGVPFVVGGGALVEGGVPPEVGGVVVVVVGGSFQGYLFVIFLSFSGQLKIRS